MTTTDCYRTPLEAQLRFTVQWFHEWSEMQRGDFLPILAQKLAPGSYVNGVLSGIENMTCNEGRPPSLFQCRVKLFHEWFETWGQNERDQFLNHIKSVDPTFYTKMQEELSTLGTSSKQSQGSSAVNGGMTGDETEETQPLNDADSESEASLATEISTAPSAE